MDQNEFIQKITDSDLSEEVKNALVARIEQEGLTEELLLDYKVALQEAIEKDLEDVGVVPDENDPVISTAKEELETAVKEANAEFAATMNELETKTKQLEQETVKQMDELEAEVVKMEIEDKAEEKTEETPAE